MPMLEAKTSTAANGNANNVTIGIVAYGANRARARRRGRRAANCGRRRCSAGAKAPRWELARLWWALHLQLAQPAWACQQVRAQPATERPGRANVVHHDDAVALGSARRDNMPACSRLVGDQRAAQWDEHGFALHHVILDGGTTLASGSIRIIVARQRIVARLGARSIDGRHRVKREHVRARGQGQRGGARRHDADPHVRHQRG